MNGTNYVPVPYSPVRGYSASNDIVIPSGKVVTGGTYYNWDDNGFIGSGWFLTNKDDMSNPMSNYGFDNVNEIEAYIMDKKDLDDVFAKWSTDLGNLDPLYASNIITNFYNQVWNKGHSCAMMNI